MSRARAVLVLENGARFEGYAWGAVGETLGEVVFSTAGNDSADIRIHDGLRNTEGEGANCPRGVIPESWQCE